MLKKHSLPRGNLISLEAGFTAVEKGWSREQLWKQSSYSGSSLLAKLRTTLLLCTTRAKSSNSYFLETLSSSYIRRCPDQMPASFLVGRGERKLLKLLPENDSNSF
jgi:hypothetical protein